MKLTSEQISLLLIEKITGTIEPDDDLLIEILLDNNSSVQREWKNLQRKLATAEADGFDINADVEAGWTKYQKLRAPKRSPQWIKPQWIKVAAAAAIIGITVLGLYLGFRKEEQPLVVSLAQPFRDDKIVLVSENGAAISLDSEDRKSVPFGNALITGSRSALAYTYSIKGKQEWSTLWVPRVLNYKIILSDGTEVSMNSKTKLRFPFSFPGKTREVFLDGEAFFKVAKNAAQPFIVHAGGTEVRVLGTSFNLNTYDSSAVRTSLVEGSVYASREARHVGLSPGFQAVYAASQHDFAVEAFDASEVLSWMEGVYHFHNASLQDLSLLLSRWYRVKVVFRNEALKKKTFSGEIKKSQPIELFLENLRLSNNIQLDVKNGVVAFQY